MGAAFIITIIGGILYIINGVQKEIKNQKTIMFGFAAFFFSMAGATIFHHLMELFTIQLIHSGASNDEINDTHE